MRIGVKGFRRGHLVIYDLDKKKWLYDDTKKPPTMERPCKRCGKSPTPEGHDACLGILPGVKFACCGHGVTRIYTKRN